MKPCIRDKKKRLGEAEYFESTAQTTVIFAFQTLGFTKSNTKYLHENRNTQNAMLCKFSVYVMYNINTNSCWQYFKKKKSFMHISKQRVYLLDWTSGSTNAVNLNLEWLTLYLVSGFLIITRSLFTLCCVHINCFHPLLFCLMLIVGIKLVMMCQPRLT